MDTTLNTELAADIAEGPDAAGSPATGYVIAAGESFSGALGGGDTDMVAIPLEAGCTYTFEVTGDGSTPLETPDLFILDEDGNVVVFGSITDDGNSAEIVYSPSESGTYYLWVLPYDGQSTGSYTLTATEGGAFPDEGTLDELADYLVEGYWAFAGSSAHNYDSPEITVNVAALRPQDQQLARWAMEAWEAVADLTFTEVSSGETLTFTDTDDGAYASPVTINISRDWSDSYGNTIDSATFSTYIHELGHALGLGHLGAYPKDPSQPGGAFPDDAVFANDSYQMSVMSYFDQLTNSYIQADFAEPITPMIADVLAIQQIYGTATGSASAGDTFWGEGMDQDTYLGTLFTAIFETPDASVYFGDPFAWTIWDESGTDTLALTSDTHDQRIDLTPEAISDVMGLVGNLVIARGTVIENLQAGSGNDDITGNDANNRIDGNNGADKLYSGAGDDTVSGGAGSDTLNGGAGADSLNGDNGDDKLVSGEGVDTLIGGNGNDTLKGNGTGDSLRGGDGDDWIEGGLGADSAFGDTGNDTLLGDAGIDLLDGGADSDSIAAGDGADSLSGGKGTDTLDGGNGADTLDGGNGADILDGLAGLDSLLGGGGADTLRGGDGTDTLKGDDGADNLDGGGGADILNGGTGADTLTGGLGADSLLGGKDDDSLDGAEGNDTLAGGAGNDTLKGDGGADVFVYEVGADLILGFSEGVDALQFDSALWGGSAMTGAEIAAAFGSHQGSTAIFDFGGGDVLTVNNVASLDAMIGDIGLA